MGKDVILNKVATIERCLSRISEEYGSDFNTNFTKQDAIILNLQRAIQAAIDAGAHYIKSNKLGLPQSSRAIFDLLEDQKIIPSQLSQNLQKMIGFRNISVHEYQTLDLAIVESVIKDGLNDLRQFSSTLISIA